MSELWPKLQGNSPRRGVGGVQPVACNFFFLVAKIYADGKKVENVLFFFSLSLLPRRHIFDDRPLSAVPTVTNASGFLWLLRNKRE